MARASTSRFLQTAKVNEVKGWILFFPAASSWQQWWLVLPLGVDASADGMQFGEKGNRSKRKQRERRSPDCNGARESSYVRDEPCQQVSFRSWEMSPASGASDTCAGAHDGNAPNRNRHRGCQPEDFKLHELRMGTAKGAGEITPIFPAERLVVRATEETSQNSWTSWWPRPTLEPRGTNCGREESLGSLLVTETPLNQPLISICRSFS